ncbi:hypothetical protein KBTX_01047 [wastewater metagenome]|uniref:Hemerythrin-like domain-containing protein n=3 Tax=root TaxID=1 RepID=A0A5B8R6T3_9ZZZZ|nr:hypothetical protein [Arhodomonas aquaeolei]MCS4503203.1 hypothetical protein [Arhodomonas aquaeolei]QEA04739.1 hypothetical protein KBTEX_01047 [uncultured organism]
MGFLHQLREEQAAIRERLDALERGLAAFHAADHPDARALHDDTLALVQALLPHHVHETQALARCLAAHEGNGRAEALRRAAERVLECGQALLEQLEDIEEDIVIPRDRLPTLGERFITVTREQLRREEQELLDAAEDTLSAGEWRRLAKSHTGATADRG